MKLSNPTTRFNLKIKRNEKVLDVGGGPNPHPRANVVTDKFVTNDFHRKGSINLYKHQKFIEADGEDLPFLDKEFDYVICNHVLEHVDNPKRFLEEQARVSTRGYIETPSLIGEHLHPKESHRWVILEIDNKLVLFDKKLIDFQTSFNFGPLFLEYLLKHSIAYKLLNKQYPQIWKVQYEWKDKIDYLINPSEEVFTNYLKTWDEKIIKSIIPQKTRLNDLLSTLPAFYDILKFQFKKKFIYGKKYPIDKDSNSIIDSTTGFNKN